MRAVWRLNAQFVGGVGQDFDSDHVNCLALSQPCRPVWTARLRSTNSVIRASRPPVRWYL
jgi:hypothetical protein